MCPIYKRFLYNINSGSQDYDLIDKYKFRINELLYSQLYVAKPSATGRKLVSILVQFVGLLLWLLNSEYLAKSFVRPKRKMRVA